MKKYELTNETIAHNGVTLYRIRALRDFTCQGVAVTAGTLGGWVYSESNLSHDGTAQITGDARGLWHRSDHWRRSGSLATLTGVPSQGLVRSTEPPPPTKIAP
jgi:hypothetical protein